MDTQNGHGTGKLLAGIMRFTCAEHAPAWASQIRGRYLVLERAEWEMSGRGYRGVELGG